MPQGGTSKSQFLPHVRNCKLWRKQQNYLCDSIVYIFEGILGNPFQRAFSFFWSEWWFTSPDRTLCDTNSKPFLCANFWSGTTIPRKAHFVLNNNVIFLYFSKFYTVQNVNVKKTRWIMPISTFASKALIMGVDKSIMALISFLKRESSVFLWLFRGKTQPWDGFSSLKPLFNVSSTFLYFLNFKFRLLPLSENICLKVFVTQKLENLRDCPEI